MNKSKYEEQIQELYAVDRNPRRKKFLDELIRFMLKRGTPITRIPTFGKEVADLYVLFNAVVKHGGILVVMKKKLWRKITDELGLSFNKTGGAPSLENKYIKNLYPFECEKHHFSTAAELCEVIDSKQSDDEEANLSDDDELEDLELVEPVLNTLKLDEMSAEELKQQMEVMVKYLAKIENKPSSEEIQTQNIEDLYNIDNDPKRKQFLDELFEFMVKRKSPIIELPIIGGQVVDLYKLYLLVVEYDGLKEVNCNRNWGQIASKVGISKYKVTGIGCRLKTIYTNLLYPFECEKEVFSTSSRVKKHENRRTKSYNEDDDDEEEDDDDKCKKYKDQVNSLYSIDKDPKRKPFLDDYFVFMRKLGSPVTRAPFLGGIILDLFKLYTLVVKHGGVVEVIRRDLFPSIGKELKIKLTPYKYRLKVKYIDFLYAYECEKEGFTTRQELQRYIRNTKINRTSNQKKIDSEEEEDDDDEVEEDDNENTNPVLDTSEMEQMSTEDLNQQMEMMVKQLKMMENKKIVDEDTRNESIEELYNIDTDPKRKDFLDDLLKFMAKRATPITQPPIIGGGVLDLYKLYNLVVQKDGFAEVTSNRSWGEIARDLNLTRVSTASFRIKQNYRKFLYRFECEKQDFNTLSDDESDESDAHKKRKEQINHLYSIDKDPKRKVFLNDFLEFMRNKGSPMKKPPLMSREIIDIYKLYKLVVNNGGLVKVIREGIFDKIAMEMNIKMKASHAKYRLRLMYSDLLYAYECEKKGFTTLQELQNCKKTTSKYKEDSEEDDNDDEDHDSDEGEEEVNEAGKRNNLAYKVRIDQLYKIDKDPKRKEFLDDLLQFMKERGTPINRPPCLNNKVLDLFKFYSLVVERKGIVEVLQLKLWTETIKSLDIPTNMSRIGLRLREHYVDFLYPFECHKQGFSNDSQLQETIEQYAYRRKRRLSTDNESEDKDNVSPSKVLKPPIESGILKKEITIRITVNGLNYEGVLKLTPRDETKKYDISISTPGFFITSHRTNTNTDPLSKRSKYSK